jgi:hypothetical protein
MVCDEVRMKYRRVDRSVIHVVRGVWKGSATVDSVSVTGLATSETQAVGRCRECYRSSSGIKK